MTKEVMKQALDALKNTTPFGFNMEADKRFYSAIEALEEALKQEQDEPLAWFREENGEKIYYETKAWDNCLALYATSQNKKWVGLTEDEIYKIAFQLEGEHWKKIFNAIDAKLKERNT